MASQEEKNCPLTPADWINYLQAWKSQIIARMMPLLQLLIAMFAIFVSILFLAELRDNVIMNFFRGLITIALVYLILLIALLIATILIPLLIWRIKINFDNDIKSIDELIKKIIDGENDSNKIREEWRKKIENPKEKQKMFNNRKIKLMLKHSLSVIGFITLAVIFVAIGLYLIDHSCKIIYALILQIVGVLLLSFWSLLEKATNAKKFIAKIMKKIIPFGENPWTHFDKMCRTTGLGLVIAGLIVELSYIL